MKKQLFILCSLCALLTACEKFENTADQKNKKPMISAGDQAESESDRKITQKIRQAIMDDDSLSTNAKNIKIITLKGVVTLRGPVDSENEKNVIGHKAKAIADVKNVDNQLDVVAPAMQP